MRPRCPHTPAPRRPHPAWARRCRQSAPQRAQGPLGVRSGQERAGICTRNGDEGVGTSEAREGCVGRSAGAPHTVGRKGLPQPVQLTSAPRCASRKRQAREVPLTVRRRL